MSGNAFGVVAPSNEGRNGEGALEFRGVPYRDSVPLGTLVLSSGLGGVFPKGIPVGTVIGTVREEAGWERVYRLRPAANPGSAAHVLVLVSSPQARDLAGAFPSDSLLEAMRLDSIARLRRADSVAQAVRAARAARRDSLARPLRSRAVPPSRSRVRSRVPDAGRHPERSSPSAEGLGPMSTNRVSRVQLLLVMLLLLVLQFYVRPRLWDARISPDFLLIALMLFAMRSRPGLAALAGFAVGLIADTLTPARFGAGALAHTLVGYLASWGRAVFFADNMLVNAGFVAAGLWLRDLIVLVASGTDHRQLITELTIYSPLQALTTAGLCAHRPDHLPQHVFRPARRMNGFDSYRLRDRADIARLVLIVAFVVLGGAFFRTQVIQHSKFQLKAETNRLRPIPLTPPRGIDPRPPRPCHRRECPGLLGQAAGFVDRFAAGGARPGAPLCAGRQRPGGRHHRALPAGPVSAGADLRRRLLRRHRQAGGAPVRPARTGHSGRAEAALSRGQIGRPTWPATSPK